MTPLGFVEVMFHNVEGQQITEIWPKELSLPEKVLLSIRHHAFPDTTVIPGDSVFAFLIRGDAWTCFAHVFCRLERNPEEKRGFSQKSLVLLSKFPFVALNKRIISLIGPAFYGSQGTFGDSDLLTAAWNECRSWPPLVYGDNYELPLLGHVLLFRAPPGRGDAHLCERPPMPAVAMKCASHVSNLDDVNVYARFPRIVPHLWLVWELVITGEPLLVYGATPGDASDAVFAVMSLVAPLEYAGDVQPFYTVQDPTFRVYSSAVEGSPLPAAVLGTSNPFFFEALARWPNILSVGEVITHGTPVGPSKRRTTNTFAQRLAMSSSNSRSAGGREVQAFTQVVASPRSEIVRAPQSVLKALISASRVQRREPMSRVASCEFSSQHSSPGTERQSTMAEKASSLLATTTETWDAVADKMFAKYKEFKGAGQAEEKEKDGEEEEKEEKEEKEEEKDGHGEEVENLVDGGDEAGDVGATADVLADEAAAPTPQAAQSTPSPSPFMSLLTSSLDKIGQQATALKGQLFAEEGEAVTQEFMLLHNNTVLRRYFFELTEAFLATCESFFLTLLPARPTGVVRSWNEDEFLKYVKARRPLVLFTNRQEGVVDLYRRFTRSVNFHKWLQTRMEHAKVSGEAQ